MGDTILSKKLLNDFFIYHNKVKHLDYVVKNSMPIVFFGDIDKYVKQDYRVITAALNPSDIEFLNHKNDNYSFEHRFPDYDNTPDSLELACKNYFKINPYNKWFGKNNRGFKPLLNGMGYCYYPNSKNLKSVLHTDICSPASTNPTWSDLTENEKNKLQVRGFELWKKLILELKPHLIILSVKKEYLESKISSPVFGFKKINNIIKPIYSSNNTFKYEIIHYHGSIDSFKTNLLWGSAQNTPFQPFPDKIKIGKILKKYFIDKKYIVPYNKEDIEIIENSKQNLSKKDVLKKNYFTLKKSLIGKNIIIEFQDKTGKTIRYNHDKLLNQLGNRITSLNCWSKYGHYSNSRELPKFIVDSNFIKYI